MSSFLSFLTPARDKLFKDKDPQGTYALLAPLLRKKPANIAERRALYELAGLCLRELKRYDEAITLYNDIGDGYQAGYCELLHGRYANVQKHWLPLIQNRGNHWCLHLYGLITRQLATYPTLFQIRNHLESDIGNLIRAGQMPMVENIVSYADFMQQLNLETCKFIGRAFFNAREVEPACLDRAAEFLMKGQKALPNDPEVYYHLGQYQLEKGELDDARVMFNQCLLISPTFLPAKELMEAHSLL